MTDNNTLWTCPRCGQANFTRRGLSRHYCASGGTERTRLSQAEMAAAKPSGPVAVSVMARWIPVEIEMPDAEASVLLATADDVVDAGFYDGEVWRWLCAATVDVKVTHWAQYPNHPKDI